MKPAVRFQHVTKTFEWNRTRQFVKTAIANRFKRQDSEPFYALRDVSFEIAHGQSVGIIGANGAGKSTTLSLMAGLATPDSGSIAVDGKVAALLELGAGFHPDLTGIENVMVNGALLGLSRRQVLARLDEIVEFAEIGEFIGQPLRTYSSGMAMRLAFAVAIYVDAEIILVDEILSVGDAHFQKKCIERVMALRNSGKTLVSVTHSEDLLPVLCEEAIYLEHGRMVKQGPVTEILALYRDRVA